MSVVGFDIFSVLLYFLCDWCRIKKKYCCKEEEKKTKF